MILPAAVIAAGLAGAFSTNAMGKKGTLANKWGYRHVSASQPCVRSIMCSDIQGEPCTVDTNVQLYELIGATCANPLFKAN